jgi:polyhydroxybutyrate depolymerase
MRGMMKAIPVLAVLLAVFPAHSDPIRTYSFDGVAREFILHRPAAVASDQSAALVVVLHGGLGSAAQAERHYGWDALADVKGFAVLYPNGVGRTWNAGGCCGPAARKSVDDLGYLAALIKDTVAREGLNPKRVFVTGMSNGGVMAYRLACSGKISLAAIGPVAASLAEGCKTPNPVSVMAIHGLDDRNIPFEGGIGPKGVTEVSWMPVGQAVGLFRASDGCQPPRRSVNGSVAREYSACTEGRAVELITIADAGHQWPGAAGPPVLRSRLLALDPPSTALDATTTLWDFFAAVP